MERKFRITVDGHPYTVTVDEIRQAGGQARTEHEPYAAPALAQAAAPADTPPAHHAAAPAPASAGDVVATLAGVVESIAAAGGQSVEKGQPVVIIGPMKMKSPMGAPRAGPVTAVIVAVGQGVDPGQILASIS